MEKNELKKFIKNIHKEYVKARKVMEGNREAKRIFRGRSRSISSIAEDMLAKLLLREIRSKEVYIFVDQPISLQGKGTTYYPDIVICKMLKKNEYEIFGMIDLKIDIGWHRKSFFKELSKYTLICNEMKKAKGLKGKKGNIEDEKKPRILFIINNKAEYDVVIVSSRNSGKNENKLISASNDKSNNIWVLSKGGGLNQYENKREIILNEKDYKVLISKIIKKLKIDKG